MNKPIYVGFAKLEFSKLHMYGTFYDKLQPYFGHENIQCHFIDTDAFVLSLNTESIIKDFKNLEIQFHLNNFDVNHELFSNKNKKKLVNLKLKLLKTFGLMNLLV